MATCSQEFFIFQEEEEEAALRTLNLRAPSPPPAPHNVLLVVKGFHIHFLIQCLSQHCKIVRVMTTLIPCQRPQRATEAE